MNDNVESGKDASQSQLSYAGGGSDYWDIHFGKQFGSFLES